jgi:hypothetical protein
MSYVREARLQYIWDISEAEVEYKEAVHAYTATWGKGYLFIELDPNRDYGEGEIIMSWVDTARVYVSPDTRKRFEDDAPCKILSTILTGEQAVNMFPNQAKWEEGKLLFNGEEVEPTSEEDFPDSGQQNTRNASTPETARNLDSSQLHYQLLQRFEYTQVPFWRVRADNIHAIMNKIEYEAADLPQNVTVRETSQRRVRHVMSLGQVLVAEPEILNTDIYPLIPLPNIWTGTPYTLADLSKIRDIQILLNKLWSLILLHTQKSAKPWLLVPEGSMDIDKYEDGEEVTEYNPDFGEPHFGQPAQLANAFYGLLQQLSFYIDFILGIPELLQGFKEGAPETLGQTELLSDFAQGRPKSKLQDIEPALARAGRVCDWYANAHYSPEKTLRIIQANNDVLGIAKQYYPDWTPQIEEIERDSKIGQYEVRVKTGSVLPNDPLAEYAVSRQAYLDQLVPRSYVLKRHPEFFDAREILEEWGEINQLTQELQATQEQLKKTEGDLQTATRGEIEAEKKTEVSRFGAQLKGTLAEIKRLGSAEVKDLTVELERQLNELALLEKELRLGKKAPEK